MFSDAGGGIWSVWHFLMLRIAPVVFCAALSFPAVWAQEEADLDLEEPAENVPDIASAGETLKQVLNPGASREEQVRYWLARERAAFAAGASDIRLESLHRLVELHKDTPQVHRYWGSLWREEWRSGNQQKALEIGEQIVASNVPDLYLRAQYAAFLAWDYSEIGDRDRAWAAIDRAERYAREYAEGGTPDRRERITALLSLYRGRLLLLDARYAETEATLRRGRAAALRAIEVARQKGEREGFLSSYDTLLRVRNTIAGLHVRLLSTVGRHVEAEAMAREALQEALGDRSRGEIIGYWHERIAITKLAQRRYAEALELTDRALDILQQAGLRPSANRVLWTRNARLQALIGLERWSDAEAEYSTMLGATANDAVGRRFVSSPLLEALLGALTGKATGVLDRVERVVRYRARLYGERNPRTMEARAVQAVVQQAAGDSRTALATYRNVFDVLFSQETERLDTATRGLRGFFMPLALQHYLKLVADLSAAGEITQELVSNAFVVSDRLRESVVQQALVDSATRVLVQGNGELLELVRKEQNLRAAMMTTYNNMIRHDRAIRRARSEIARLKAAKADPSALIAELKSLRQAMQAERKQLEPFQQQQREIRSQLAKRFPEYHRLVNPVPMTPDDIAKRLRPEEVLVSIYPTPAHTFIWAIRSGSDPSLHIAAVGADSIARDVARLRATLELEGRTSPAPYAAATAHKLYAELLQPIAPLLNGQRILTVVAGGALGQIPFALLRTRPGNGDEQDGWLVNDIAIAHASSVTAWSAVRETAGKLSAGKPFLGFGDPQFAVSEKPTEVKQVRALIRNAVNNRLAPASYSSLPALPETREEIVAIAKALGADVQQSTFFGPSATRSAVLKSNLAEQRVVAFATHGLRAGDMENLSQPALAMAVPRSAEDTPLLTLDDILGLKVAADMVVLSACNTASDDGASGEAISGLGRGFFFAGARSMLVTHWAVETRSAQALVKAFFAQDKGTRAERLREAQMQMLQGKIDPRYRHPAFWAPYALIGDGVK
ncbi:MAG TPA: CHAT domain-containing protein [Burkholderiales bacterium]|nr:CHAT domain-containing protein [Burkholderiales bacterium]